MFWVLMKNLTNSFPFTNNNQKGSTSSNPGTKTKAKKKPTDSRKRISYNLLAMNDKEVDLSMAEDDEDDEDDEDSDAYEVSERGEEEDGHIMTTQSNSIFKNSFKSRDDYGRLESIPHQSGEEIEPFSHGNRPSSGGGSTSNSSNFAKFSKTTPTNPTTTTTIKGSSGGKTGIVGRALSDLGLRPKQPKETGGTTSGTNTLTALKFTFEDFSDEDESYDEDDSESDEEDEDCQGGGGSGRGDGKDQGDDEDGDVDDYGKEIHQNPTAHTCAASTVSPSSHHHHQHESCSTDDEYSSASSSSSTTNTSPHNFQKPQHQHHRAEITGTRTIAKLRSTT